MMMNSFAQGCVAATTAVVCASVPSPSEVVTSHNHLLVPVKIQRNKFTQADRSIKIQTEQPKTIVASIQPNTIELEADPMAAFSEFMEDDEFKRGVQEATKEFSVLFKGENGKPTMKSLRMKAGLSQAEVSKELGSSQSYISRLEKGAIKPGTDRLIELANLYQTTVDELIEALDV